MSMMDVCGPVYCPKCKPVFNKHKRRLDPPLVCSSANYSGCGVDMANCPTCGKGYQISYKIDKVAHCKDWDVDLEAEKESEKRAKVDRVKEAEKNLQKAKQELEVSLADAEHV